MRRLVTVPRAALSFVLENVDVVRASGDCLRELQDRFELTTIEEYGRAPAGGSTDPSDED